LTIIPQEFVNPLGETSPLQLTLHNTAPFFRWKWAEIFRVKDYHCSINSNYLGLKYLPTGSNAYPLRFTKYKYWAQSRIKGASSRVTSSLSECHEFNFIASKKASKKSLDGYLDLNTGSNCCISLVERSCWQVGSVDREKGFIYTGILETICLTSLSSFKWTKNPLCKTWDRRQAWKLVHFRKLDLKLSNNSFDQIIPQFYALNNQINHHDLYK
jgi:hypothetical protein